MKILYGITKSNFGGAQRYVFDLALEARKAGHEVAVMCGGKGPLYDKLEGNGIKVISIKGFGRDIDLIRDASRLRQIIKIVRQEKPDVFHINSAKMGGAGIFAGRLLGVPRIIFTAHGWAFNEPRPLWQKWLIRFFTWLTIFSAHRTICVSQKTCDQVSSWPLISHKLLVVKNGIEAFLLKERDHARAELGAPAETLAVGTLAELHPIKGLDVLLRAWSRFVPNRNAKLIILGEGEARSSLEKMITDLGIQDSVLLNGYVENARQFLRAFDIFILPSRSEAMPYTILEAGFASLPVIASRVGGIPEVIETGINGILIEPEKPDEILSSLILLSEDVNLRQRLGSALHEKTVDEFSISKMAHDTLKVYV